MKENKLLEFFGFFGKKKHNLIETTGLEHNRLLSPSSEFPADLSLSVFFPIESQRSHSPRRCKSYQPMLFLALLDNESLF